MSVNPKAHGRYGSNLKTVLQIDIISIPWVLSFNERDESTLLQAMTWYRQAPGPILT